MIDINFEKYSETVLEDFKLTDMYMIQNWIHCTVTFTTTNMPEDIIDPQALIIMNSDKEILQIVLHEEGCDSPNYQFTEKEKEQIMNWFRTEKVEL
ncbi:hypothetical protein [Bacillus sp. FJAT-45350]|uniref:hypothetical protein n=1 Tax=Bacillus sp. FJAT-45350 TaxID=2011014 RepID=UPI000BB9AB5B|nr:hypothetical protein [Bacillus sp. FJAT-45350]